MPIERERKFLVEKLPEGVLSRAEESVDIFQEYLYRDSFTAIRRRKIVRGGEERFYYTVKTDRKGNAVTELEQEISREEYEKLKKYPGSAAIVKTRYKIPYGKHTIELDIFGGQYKGCIFAEIEFDSEEEAEGITLPRWFSKELTGRVSNAKMAMSEREEIDRMINTIHPLKGGM